MYEIFFEICNNLACSKHIIYKIIRESFIYGITAMILAYIISPLKFLAIQRQQTGFKYSDILKQKLKDYGYYIFYSGAIPYSIFQFISSASFGLSEILSDRFLQAMSINATAIIIIFKILITGFIETVTTIYPEAKEIKKNKIGLMETSGTILSVFTPVFIRNSLSWVGTILTIYTLQMLKQKYGIEFNTFQFLCITLIMGVIFSFITVPFDVIVTQNFGSKDNLTFIERIRYNISNNNIDILFRGSTLRILMLALYTVCTVCIDKILH